MESSYENDAKVFKALCDPRRLAILERLRSGEKCVCMDRCRGCQRVCSNGAISYAGDNSEVSDCCKCC